MKRLILGIFVFLMVIGLQKQNAFAAPEKTIEGIFIGIDGNKIKVQGEDQKVSSILLDEKAISIVDNRGIPLKDFKRGMEVYVEVEKNKAVFIEAFSVENPGYIPIGSKVRMGKVAKIDRDKIEIITSIGIKETYFLDPSYTMVYKDKKLQELKVLYEGDNVRMYFDDIHTQMPSKVEIQGSSIEIQNIYQGKLSSVDSVRKRMVIENSKVFLNGKWKDVQYKMYVPYNEEEPLYINGQTLHFSQLKKYIGKDLYYVTKNHFGKEKAERVIVKQSYQNSYESKITHINFYADTLKLKNNRNIRFYPGTPVIYNGRLVDIHTLEKNYDIFVITEGYQNTPNANLIYVLNKNLNHNNISQDHIYTGKIEDVFEDVVSLVDFSVLEEHEWIGYTTKKDLYFDEETTIYDERSGHFITKSDFWINFDKKKVNYAYVYTNGDRIANIILRDKKEEIQYDRVITGIIKEVEDNVMLGWKATIEQPRDWLVRSKSWKISSSPISFVIENAMIIKEGTLISVEDLKPRDQIYVVKDIVTNKAKVVIVK